MRDNCVFVKHDKKSRKCSYPMPIKICWICYAYVPNDGDIDKKLPYMKFVADRSNAVTATAISITALIISILAMLINAAKLLFGK